MTEDTRDKIDEFQSYIDFIDNQKSGLKKLFLVHGELDRQQKFSKLLNENGFLNVEIPELGQEFEI